MKGIKTFSEFLQEEKNESYVEYVARNLDNSISYSDYLAENLDNSISYSQYLSECLDRNENFIVSGICHTTKLFTYDAVADPGFSNARMSNIRKCIYIAISDTELFDHLYGYMAEWQLTLKQRHLNKIEEVCLGESKVTGEKVYRVNNEFFIKVLYEKEKNYLLNCFEYLSNVNGNIGNTLDRMHQYLNEDEINDVLNSLPSTIDYNIRQCYISSAKTYGNFEPWELNDKNYGTSGESGMSGTTGFSGKSGVSGTSGCTNSTMSSGLTERIWIEDSGFKIKMYVPGNSNPYKIENDLPEEFIGTSRVNGLPVFKRGNVYVQYDNNLDKHFGNGEVVVPVPSIININDHPISSTPFNQNGRWYSGGWHNGEWQLDTTSTTINHPKIEKNLIFRTYEFFQKLFRLILEKLSFKKGLKEEVKICDNEEFSKKFFESLEEFKDYEKILVEHNKIKNNEN